MKRLALTIISVFLLTCTAGFGQGKMYTKSKRLEDFSSHTTRVVLNSDSVLDQMLREAVHARWRLNPYEFCTVKEYEEQKTDPSFYFLRCVLASDRKGMDTGLAYLILSKGGDPKNKESLDAAFDVLSVPFAPETGSDGREFIYLPAMVSIIQQYVDDVIMSERSALSGLHSSTLKLMGTNRKKIVIAERDVAPDARQTGRLSTAVEILEFPEQVDDIFLSGTDSVLVGISISSKGYGLCAQMVLDPSSHELLFYSEHPASGKRGFRKSELKFFKRHFR